MKYVTLHFQGGGPRDGEVANFAADQFSLGGHIFFEFEGAPGRWHIYSSIVEWVGDTGVRLLYLGATYYPDR